MLAAKTVVLLLAASGLPATQALGAASSPRSWRWSTPTYYPAAESSISNAWSGGLFSAQAPSVASIPTPAYIPPSPSSFILPPAPPASYQADASINFGNAGFSEASLLTDGKSSAWYNSPVVQKFDPNAANDPAFQAAFVNAVVQHVQQTYQQSGLHLTVTADPSVSAAHTLSVVSGASNPGNPDAVGITDVGHDGFSFLDKFVYASSVDELEWVVAHNIAHELMHAFGGGHHDKTGKYLDGAIAPWSTLADPATSFGPDSVAELLSHNFRAVGSNVYPAGAEGLTGPEDGARFSPPAVPEPATIALWTLGGLAAWVVRRRRAA